MQAISRLVPAVFTVLMKMNLCSWEMIMSERPALPRPCAGSPAVPRPQALMLGYSPST